MSEPPPPIRALFIEGSVFPSGPAADMTRGEAGIEVYSAAADPFAARERIVEFRPDVVVLDLEMERMDAMLFFKILMEQAPMPVVAMSSLTPQGSRLALDALELGAVDVFVRSSSGHLAPGQGGALSAKLKAAAHAKFRSPVPKPSAGIPSPPKGVGKSLVLLGASTGGTEALREILVQLPRDLPPVCIVQHIPSNFSRPFAERLNTVSRLAVKEAANGDVLRPGSAFVAPGDKHMLVGRDTAGNLYLKIRDGGKIMHHRPSVDLMFESAAALAGAETVAGLLTGMGRDGAAGLLKLRQAGAKTFAQDEPTSVVYGMPRAAADIGAAESILPLGEIAEHIVRACAPRRPQAA
jgi:two-component system, chemotaxis family, protein-glutamate methylesterase/glutaminase